MSENSKNGGPGKGVEGTEGPRTTSRPEPVRPSERAERAAIPRGRGPELSRHQDQAVHAGGDGEEDGLLSRVRHAADDRSEALRERAEHLYEEAASRVGGAYEHAKEWARDKYEGGAGWASDRYERGTRYAEIARRRSLARMRHGSGAVQSFAHENPLLVGVIGLAAGLVIGSLLPRTRREDRTFGRYADEAREHGLRYAREAARRGREYVEEQFTDEDPRFAHHDSEFQRRSRGSEREGPSGRFQNH